MGTKKTNSGHIDQEPGGGRKESPMSRSHVYRDHKAGTGQENNGVSFLSVTNFVAFRRVAAALPGMETQDNKPNTEDSILTSTSTHIPSHVTSYSLSSHYTP